ncbi:MAG: pitrilysin family protein [Pseudomonadota bacterium]
MSAGDQWNGAPRHRMTPAVRSSGVTGGLAAAMILSAAPAMDGGVAQASTQIQEVTSPGGVEAWLVEEQGLPIISIEISFIGGASLDPDGKAGLAALLTGMLDEGAGPYDSAAFSLRQDEIAARISFSAGRDTIGAKLTMLRDKREESLELFRAALNEPRFDAEPLEKVMGQYRSVLRQHSQDPNRLANDAFYGAMFPGDPYGRPRLGTIESMGSITAEDLRAAMPRLLNRSRMKVGVVGAVTAEELGPMLDAVLGDLAGADAAPAELPQAPPSAPGGKTVVDFDAPQSTLLFGHGGVPRSDPDFIAAYVMNYILGGGGFSSRLTEEVREKRGLTYGVGSFLSPMDRAALYVGYVSTSNDKVTEAIDVIRDEWTRMAEEGPSAEELDGAKRYLTGAYPLRFDSNAKIANFLVQAQLDDLGIDYIATRNALVEAVTLDDVKRVAARLLKPDDLFFAIAGRPELETATP